MPENTSEAERVAAYHDRTKHRLDRYAAGPDTLDWSMQPDPFRKPQGQVYKRSIHAGY
jgi:hypothetical protein